MQSSVNLRSSAASMVCDACPTISSAIWKTIVVIGVTNAIAVSCFLYFVIFFLSAVQVFYLNGKPVIIYHQRGSEGLCNILMNPSPHPPENHVALPKTKSFLPPSRGINNEQCLTISFGLSTTEAFFSSYYNRQGLLWSISVSLCWEWTMYPWFVPMWWKAGMRGWLRRTQL